jgi:hypothetical protein
MKDIQKIQEFFSKRLQEGSAINMAKKKLDALGVKYEMSKTDKVRPFKVIYKPINKSDKFYDEFEDIVDLFNLKGFVKSSMNEASPITKLGRKIGWAGEDWTPQEFAAQIKKLSDETLLKWAESNKGIGKGIPNTPLAFQQKLVKIELAKRGLTEASKDEETEFHKKLDKLVHNTFGKRKGELEEEELTEANVPSNIADFAKRKGVSSLVRKVAGWAEKVGARIAGGTAVGKNYSTLVLDLDYKQRGEIRINTDMETVTLYNKPVTSFPEFKRAYEANKPVDEASDYMKRKQKDLAEAVLSKLKK